MLNKRDTNIKKCLFEDGDSQLGLDHIAPVDDLVEGFRDGSTADHDVVSSDSVVPVLAALESR